MSKLQFKFAEIEIRLRVIRLDLNGPVKFVYGVRNFARLAQRHAETVVKNRAAGHLPEGFGQVAFRLAEPAGFNQFTSKVVLKINVAGFDARGLPVVFDGFVRLSVSGQNGSQQVVGGGVSGAYRDGLFE